MVGHANAVEVVENVHLIEPALVEHYRQAALRCARAHIYGRLWPRQRPDGRSQGQLQRIKPTILHVFWLPLSAFVARREPLLVLFFISVMPDT